MINVMYSKQISVGTRLATMLLDHFFMTMIAMVFFIPGMIAMFSEAFKMSHEQRSPGFMGGAFWYIGMLGFALYFCKDIFNGRSIAKRILKLQVVDNKTGQVASPLQCFVRDVLCVLWPVEFIVAMVNPNRRLGDRIAGTRLVPFDPSLAQPRIHVGKTILPIGISYGLMLLFMQVFPEKELSKANYSETSINQPESKAMAQLLTDSLGQYLAPDVRIYDTVTGTNLKYISAILQLKENYIGDEISYSRLNETTTRLIYEQFPKETFTGQLQYIYRAPGQFQSRTITIGADPVYKAGD